MRGARRSHRGAVRAPRRPSPGTAPRAARTSRTGSTRPSSRPRSPTAAPPGRRRRSPSTRPHPVSPAPPCPPHPSARTATARTRPPRSPTVPRRPAASASGSWTPAATSCAGSTAGVRARLARTRVSWDGRIASGGGLVAAAEGVYRFVVERRDDAGNVARQGLKVTLDRTLGRPVAAPVTISPDGDGVRDTTKLGFTLSRRGHRQGAHPGRRRGRPHAGAGRPLGRRTLRRVGRTGRLRRVPRQLPAHLHRHRRLGHRREQRDQGSGRRPLPPEALRRSRQDDDGGHRPRS